MLKKEGVNGYWVITKQTQPKTLKAVELAVFPNKRGPYVYPDEEEFRPQNQTSMGFNLGCTI